MLLTAHPLLTDDCAAIFGGAASPGLPVAAVPNPTAQARAGHIPSSREGSVIPCHRMWSVVTRSRRHRRPHRAAVRGGRLPRRDAPDLLPLRAGDVLVVNAARATPPRARHLPRRPHPLRSGTGGGGCPPANLYAGVLVASRRAVVGSTAASRGSTIADEAVMITDDPRTITAARQVHRHPRRDNRSRPRIPTPPRSGRSAGSCPLPGSAVGYALNPNSSPPRSPECTCDTASTTNPGPAVDVEDNDTAESFELPRRRPVRRRTHRPRHRQTSRRIHLHPLLPGPSSAGKQQLTCRHCA
jgi:hypothetical protein